jgi:CcmD family protein
MTTPPSRRHPPAIPCSPDASWRRAAALAVVAVMAFSALGAGAVFAQETGLPAAQMGQQSLRPYWHVFVAYTIVIVMIGGWAFSIARRLRNIEDRLID